jgi:hypothetical protein
MMRVLRAFSGARFDPRDPDGGVRLAMALPAPVVLPALELHDHDLPVATGPHDLTHDARAAEPGGVHDGIALGSKVRHLPKLHGVALPGGKSLDADDVALSNPILFASGDDHGFHGTASSENCGKRELLEGTI